MDGRLFHRTGRGVTLTELGQQLRPRISGILADLSALAEDARGERDSPRGDVVLGVVPSMSRPLVSRLCAQLRQEHPRIRLKAVKAYSGDVERMLANGHLQIGIFNRYGNGRVPGADLLLRSELALVVPRGRFLLPSGSVALRALADLPLALPVRPNALVARISDLAARQGFTLDIAFKGGNGTMVQDAVAHAALCNLVPMHLAERDYGDGAFDVRRIVKPAIRQQTWLAVSSQSPPSAATRIALKILRTDDPR